jgi:uncharacterized membrane protein
VDKDILLIKTPKKALNEPIFMQRLIDVMGKRTVSSWLGKILCASVGMLSVVTNGRLLMEGQWTMSVYLP